MTENIRDRVVEALAVLLRARATPIGRASVDAMIESDARGFELVASIGDHRLGRSYSLANADEVSAAMAVLRHEKGLPPV